MQFDAAERQIFEYRDGSVNDAGEMTTRRGDPVVIYGRLMAEAGGEEHFSALCAGGALSNPNDAQWRDKISNIICRAFDIIPLAGRSREGLTVTEIVGVLCDFFEWQKKSETNGDGLPNISPPIQDSPSRSIPSPTTPMSACGSTETVSSRSLRP